MVVTRQRNTKPTLSAQFYLVRHLVENPGATGVVYNREDWEYAVSKMDLRWMANAERTRWELENGSSVILKDISNIGDAGSAG